MDQALKSSTVVIPDGSLNTFLDRVKKLNAKAAKFKLPEITFGTPRLAAYRVIAEEVGADFDKMVVTKVRLRDGVKPDSEWVIAQMLEIDLSYPIVKLGNWQVVGKIERLQEGVDNLIFSITDAADNESYLESLRSLPIECDHCKQNRARASSFGLRDIETGEFKQVGSTCLEDFTGINPAAVLFLAQLHKVVQLFSEEFGSYSRSNCEPLEDYVAATMFLIRRDGFLSSGKAQESGRPATFVQASHDVFYRALNESKSALQDWLTSRDSISVQARAFIANARIEQPKDSFEANVKALSQSDFISNDPKHRAVMAGGVSGYLRKIHAAKVSEIQGVSAHFGQAGEKRVSKVRVTGSTKYESQYGTQFLIFLTDESGNVAKWKTGTPKQLGQPHNLDRWFKAEFKIKGHSEYNEVKQTEITHLKIKEWLQAPAIQHGNRGYVYGTAKAKESDRFMLENYGFELKDYDHALGGYVARMSVEAHDIAQKEIGFAEFNKCFGEFYLDDGKEDEQEIVADSKRWKECASLRTRVAFMRWSGDRDGQQRLGEVIRALEAEFAGPSLAGP